MKKRLLKVVALLIAFVSVATFYGCEEEDSVKLGEAKIQLNMPSDYQYVSMDSIVITAKNQYTGYTSTYTPDSSASVSVMLEEGVYTFEANVSFTVDTVFSDGTTGNCLVNIVGITQNVSIKETVVGLFTPVAIDMLASVINPEGGWVIKEIFYAGAKSVLDTTKAYNYGQFIEIYNNSNMVLYADGLSIGETQLNNSDNNSGIYDAEINDSTYLRTMYTIPGNGTTYPVQPGNSILIAPQPILHDSCAPSIDLRMSDFQWYDKTNGLTIDVPEVPNLIRHYSYSATVWILRVNGAATFALFKIPGLDSTYVDNHYEERLNNKGTLKVKSVSVSNSNIIDVVETRETKFTGKMVSVALDAGYVESYVTKTGKSIRRKVKEVKSDGRVVYQDTNNSTDDFLADVDPQPKIFR